MPEFAPVLNVSTLNGANGFRLDGDAIDDLSGRALGGGGDVNGDGFTDLLIGTAYSDSGGLNRGLAWVVFGGGMPPAAQGLAARVAAGSAYRFQGETALDRAGISISNAGDVNGDGFDDFIFGAWQADPDVAAGNRGASYLIFGGPAKLEALDAADGNNDNQLSPTLLVPATGYRFDGVGGGDYSGFSVSGAGDVNGDGFDDLVIGSPNADPNSGVANNNEGASVIVFGGANLVDLDNDDGLVDGRIDLVQVSTGQGLRLDGVGDNAGDFSGRSVAHAGDVNGDGFDDVLIGARYAGPTGEGNTNEGAAYLIFGGPTGVFTTASLDLEGLTGVEGTLFYGAASGEQAGYSVNGLGDINGDGLADFIIGAPLANPNGNGAGSAYVVFGRTAFGAFRGLATLTGADGFRLDGLRPGDRTAINVSAAGDVNGDGFGDILVDASNFGRLGAPEAGAAFVVFGKASGFAPVLDLGGLTGDTGFRIEGAAGSDYLGFGLTAAGDINGDGFDDFAVAASRASNNLLNDSGATYVIYGHRAETAVTRVGTALDNKINGGREDDSVSGLGGNDMLLGWEGDDTIDGGAGNDTIDAGLDDDTISAGSGNDTVDGQDGTDRITLGGGTDILYVSFGDDDASGGSGRDALYFSRLGTQPAIIDMLAGTVIFNNADGDIMTFREFEQIRAGNGNDTILGDNKANTLLQGNLGNDTIDGRGGNDFISGNSGRDVMTGGTGIDTFDFNRTADSGISAATRDVIADFKAGGELDKIDLVDIDAIVGGGTSNDTFSFVVTFTAAGQVRAVQSGADTIIEINTSGVSGAESSILLTGITATTITAADFFL